MTNKTDPKDVEAELRLKIRKEIQSLKDGLDTNAVNEAKCAWCEETEDNIMALIKPSNQALLERVEKELNLFTAEHDQPMRDEALAIIKSIQKEYL